MTISYEDYLGFKDTAADRSVLKDPTRRMRTASLFQEVGLTSTPPLYSLRPEDFNGLPSAYQIYMHSVDEYDAAIKLVGTLRHWRRLLKTKWFLNGDRARGYEGLIQWREDMRQRDASMSKGTLLSRTLGGDTSAARKILDTAKQEAPESVGRPKTKAAKQAAAEEADAGKSRDKLAELHKTWKQEA